MRGGGESRGSGARPPTPGCSLPRPGAGGGPPRVLRCAPPAACGIDFTPVRGGGPGLAGGGGAPAPSPPARPPLVHFHRGQLLRANARPVRLGVCPPPGCVRGRHREQNSMSKVADAPASMAERGMTRDRPRGPRSASSTGVSDPSWAMRGDPARAGGLPPRQDAARDRRHRTGTRRARGAVRTVPREVEFLDRCKTNWGESARHACLRQSRTRVWGSKMIRYRRSPYPKRCQQGPGGVHPIVARPAGAAPPATRNPKPLGSGGSTVARLKLKGVDGTTPQGVEYAA